MAVPPVTLGGLTAEQILAQGYAIPNVPVMPGFTQPVVAQMMPTTAQYQATPGAYVPVPLQQPPGRFPTVAAQPPAVAPQPEMYRPGFLGLFGPQEARPAAGTPEAMQLQARRQLERGAALSGAAQAAQLGAALIPTAQDIENRERRRELEAEIAGLEQEIETGEFGLTPEQREAMEQAMVGTVGTMAREARMREESAAAAAPTTSAAQQVRARREARRAVQQAAQQAGAAIEQADIQEAARQLQETEGRLRAAQLEEQQRIAYRGQRQRELLGLGARTIGEAAGIAGQIAGAQAIQGVDPAEWAAMSPLEQQLYQRAYGGGDTQSLAWLQLSRAIAEQKETP